MIVIKKCPICGTKGKIWKEDPDVFLCPNCLSLYSEFGLVIESDQKPMNLCN